VVLEDFAELRKAGLTHFMMDKPKSGLPLAADAFAARNKPAAQGRQIAELTSVFVFFGRDG
jgi:hypothetical protein